MHDKDVVRGVPDIILLGMNILHVHSPIDEILPHTTLAQTPLSVFPYTGKSLSLQCVPGKRATGTQICRVSILL